MSAHNTYSPEVLAAAWRRIETSGAEQWLNEHVEPNGLSGILEQHDVELFIKNLSPNVRGLTIPRHPTGYRMAISDRLCQVERRFTIAHEIGHIFLREYQGQEFGSLSGMMRKNSLSEQTEAFCDLFGYLAISTY